MQQKSNRQHKDSEGGGLWKGEKNKREKAEKNWETEQVD